MSASRYLRRLFLWRWITTVRLLLSQVRYHPTASLNGPLKCFFLGPGTTVGARTRLNCDPPDTLELDQNVWMGSDVEMEVVGGIRIGCGTTIQRRSTINGAVTVGNSCIFAPNVFISSGTHPFRDLPWLAIRDQEKRIRAAKGSLQSIHKPVVIQDDCWLGINVVVCPGVKIGKGSVVGANSVVVSDIPPYSVYAGVPAKEIGKRLQWKPTHQIDTSRDEDLVYLLSGKYRRLESERRCVEIAQNGTIEAVLSSAGGEALLNIDFEATTDGKINIVGQEKPFSRGRNHLTVDISDSTKDESEFFTINLSAVDFSNETRVLVDRLYLD